MAGKNLPDWDDFVLIRAFENGMIFDGKDHESENYDGDNHNSIKKEKEGKDHESENYDGHNHNSIKKEKEWREGDFCQALYPYDGLMYEAKIISICDDTCIVDFLGYDDELQVHVDTLMKSRGRQVRKNQIWKAAKSWNYTSNWREGDYCQAFYPYDGLMYEAEIISICDDICTVDLLGYDEELRVFSYSLSESGGEKARKKQIWRARPLNRNCLANNWREGDYCQALYPFDGVMYEAEIISICDDICIVDFLGYDEELKVFLHTLSKSGGEKARKKQIWRAKYLNRSNCLASNDESAGGYDTRYDSRMDSEKKHNRYIHGNRIPNRSLTDNNTTEAAENSFYTIYEAPDHYDSDSPPSVQNYED